MIRTLFLLAAALFTPQWTVPLHVPVTPAAAPVGFGIAGTCVASSTSCALNSNPTSTSDVLIAVISTYVTTGNPITAVSGCGATWTFDTNVNNSTSAIGTNPTPGPCTISFTAVAGGFPYLCAAAVHGSTGGVDNHSAIALANTGTGTAPSVTATNAADLIVGLYVDSGVNGGTYTAGTGYTVKVQGGDGCAIESKTITATGAYAPTITYSASNSSLLGASIAIKP